MCRDGVLWPSADRYPSVAEQAGPGACSKLATARRPPLLFVGGVVDDVQPPSASAATVPTTMTRPRADAGPAALRHRMALLPGRGSEWPGAYCLTIVIATVSKRVASAFWKTTVPLRRLVVVSEAIPLNSTPAPVLGFPPMPTAH
jgi:hypothetical protein